jgi:hypothetical protein
MRLRILVSITITLVVLISCSKNNNITTPISCLINDTPYYFTLGSFIKDTSGAYWLHATDSRQNEIYLQAFYPYAIGTSSGTGPSSAYINGIYYSASVYASSNGYLTISISSNHDSLVNGTFSGYMAQARPTGQQTIKITNGVFRNVPVQH